MGAVVFPIFLWLSTVHGPSLSFGGCCMGRAPGPYVGQGSLSEFWWLLHGAGPWSIHGQGSSLSFGGCCMGRVPGPYMGKGPGRRGLL